MHLTACWLLCTRGCDIRHIGECTYVCKSGSEVMIFLRQLSGWLNMKKIAVVVSVLNPFLPTCDVFALEILTWYIPRCRFHPG